MEKTFVQKCNTIEDTKTLAEKFAKLVSAQGAFVNLYGEIGAGKTAFARLVAEAIGVKEKVTSPSFVILNEYHSAIIPIYHFDLYRLEKEGVKTIIDELTEYSRPNVLTCVEWAEFSDFELPFNRIEIKISYVDETVRTFEFFAEGEDYKKMLEGVKS